MFTGLIQDVGRVGRVERAGTGSRFFIKTRFAAKGFSQGESIAVNGCCLTVTEFDATGFGCEASKETLDRTSLGDLAQDSPVNLERALRLGDALGGHLVQGHVDGTAKPAGCEPDGNCYRMAFDLAPGLSRYVIEKGSIALDGISLTVNRIAGNRVDVNIIPATWEKTNLSSRKPGARVNVEVDLLGKYVEKLLGAFPREPAAAAKKTKTKAKPRKKRG